MSRLCTTNRRFYWSQLARNRGAGPLDGPVHLLQNGTNFQGHLWILADGVVLQCRSDLMLFCFISTLDECVVLWCLCRA